MTRRAAASLCLSLSLLIGCGDGQEASSDGELQSERSGGSQGMVEAGSIQATLGGEDRTWIALFMDRDSGPEATSTYQSRAIGGLTSHSLSLGGHVGRSPSVDGSIRITVMTTDALDACPCTFENSETIEYWVDFPDDRYEANTANVTVDRFVSTADGTFEAAGSFSGVLGRPADMADADPSDTLSIEGTFEVARIVQVGR
jgi:hypothetical protein